MSLSLSINHRQTIEFFEQLGTLLNAGLPLERSLSMAGQTGEDSFQRHLEAMAQSIAAGQNLATTLSRYPQYFDGWTVSLIRLAEYSGSLAEGCHRIAQNLDRQQRRQKLYRSASWTLVLTLISLVTLGVVLVQGNNNHLLRLGFWVAFLLLLGLIMVLIYGLASRRLDTKLYRLLLKVPVIGQLIQIRAVLHFTELALPLGCGVPLLTAVELIRDRMPDPDLAAGLGVAARQIRGGQPLSQGLQGCLPGIALSMVRTGEETGELDEMLQSMARYYGTELEKNLQLIQAILRPIGLLALGSLVLYLGIQMIRSGIDSLPN
ncbi:hypothetical protein BST81_16160 [Leptolyngbya sp. 'hensonii']|uniref:type II secretion system F family protein n=1 Tax=Leptolyngbya sp. 'hensonii' TaxID=1922337 RepID=UPI00094FF24A|nr:type II secretion system F family protein [Leptolyngbya sp. 'hensonii']OLP17336.1 hypothetical protein BST81_16160 [Leptolyngbya sp. 'hensonii']